MTTAAELPAVGETIRDEPLPLQPKATRLQSLDIFRGITIVGMLLVNNLTDEEHSYKVLLHSPWDGWTPTDLIFPFFLFIVGVAIPFSMAKRRSDPTETRARMLGQIWLRALSLFMLGMLIRVIYSNMPPLQQGYPMLHVMRWVVNIFGYTSIVALLWPIRSRRITNWLSPAVAVIFLALFGLMHLVVRRATNSGLPQSSIGSQIYAPHLMRIPGVLHRIGICYGIAATIALFAGWRTILACSIVMLALYSALMLKAPLHTEPIQPNHVVGSLTHDDNLEGRIDEYVFDHYTLNAQGKRDYSRKHTYSDYADPEGILSTIPATVTPLLGILLGLWLRSDRSNLEKCATMLSMGVLVTIMGCCLSAWLMPINKKIWSPSFVVFTAGMAMLGLGAIFWLVDVRGYRRWSVPFAVFGMNSIAAYVGADIIARVAQFIKVHGTPLDEVVKKSCVGWVQHFSAWLQLHSTHFPILDTPANLTVVFAFVLIFATLLLLTPLYAFKIYLKV